VIYIIEGYIRGVSKGELRGLEHHLSKWSNRGKIVKNGIDK